MSNTQPKIIFIVVRQQMCITLFFAPCDSHEISALVYNKILVQYVETRNGGHEGTGGMMGKNVQADGGWAFD